MRILLVTYHYPPDRAVGGQRAEKVADALRTASHEVVALAAGPGAGNEEVQRVIPLPSCRDLYTRWRGHSQGSVGDDTSATSTSDTSHAETARSVPWWKRWIHSLIWLPDDRQGFILAAVRRAMTLPGGAPDVVYTTSPPHSVHLAGLLLSVLTGARWIAEFRDPWTANPWKPASMKSAFSEWLERKLEWLCLETADLVVPVSEGIGNRIAERGTRTPVVTVRNGIERLRTGDEVEADIRRDAPFEMVYTGTFYHARDPFPFLEAVRKLVTEAALEPADLTVRLISGTDHYQGRSIPEFLRHESLDHHVHFEDWMEPARALRHVERADALLLLALDQPDQVPNKLYDYLGARRPILAVADADGESTRMLEEVGGHIVVPVNETEPIRAALQRMLRDGRTGPVGDPDVLEGWTTAAQMARLCGEIEALGP